MLRVLAETPEGCTLNELATVIGQRTVIASRFVSHLMKRGHVEYRSDSDDKLDLRVGSPVLVATPEGVRAVGNPEQ